MHHCCSNHLAFGQLLLHCYTWNMLSDASLFLLLCHVVSWHTTLCRFELHVNIMGADDVLSESHKRVSKSLAAPTLQLYRIIKSVHPSPTSSHNSFFQTSTCDASRNPFSQSSTYNVKAGRLCSSVQCLVRPSVFI